MDVLPLCPPMAKGDITMTVKKNWYGSFRFCRTTKLRFYLVDFDVNPCKSSIVINEIFYDSMRLAMKIHCNDGLRPVLLFLHEEFPH